MAWAHGTFHHFGHRAEVEGAGVGLGVDFSHRGNESVVGAKALKESAVGFLGARVGLKVGGVVELSGVDENTHHHNIIFFACAFNQRRVAGVESSHRRYKSYCLAFGAGSVDDFVKVLDSTDYFHFLFR